MRRFGLELAERLPPKKLRLAKKERYGAKASAKRRCGLPDCNRSFEGVVASDQCSLFVGHELID
jgi:hypothetical protein